MAERPFGVSVVIPTHNRPEELCRAVASVVSRTPGRVEIVVVDDASAPEKWVELPLANRSGIAIRQYRLTRNRGAQAARNLGIRRARFRFVAFLDSDDEFSSVKIDRVLGVLESERIDLLFHAAEGMYRYGQLNALWAQRFSRWINFRWWVSVFNPVVTPTLIVRRAIRLGPPSLRHCEDYAFLLRYCEPGVRVTYLQEKLTAVHRRPGAAGGLSAAAWRMRKGEFVARQVLCRRRNVVDSARYTLGSIFGVARLVADVIRLRYWR